MAARGVIGRVHATTGIGPWSARVPTRGQILGFFLGEFSLLLGVDHVMGWIVLG